MTESDHARQSSTGAKSGSSPWLSAFKPSKAFKGLSKPGEAAGSYLVGPVVRLHSARSLFMVAETHVLNGRPDSMLPLISIGPDMLYSVYVLLMTMEHTTMLPVIDSLSLHSATPFSKPPRATTSGQ